MSEKSVYILQFFLNGTFSDVSFGLFTVRWIQSSTSRLMSVICFESDDGQKCSLQNTFLLVQVS